MTGMLSQDEKIKRGAEDSGRYFRYMAEYVGFTDEDARAIHESGLIIEKYIPDIVAKFYSQLLRYGPTRKYFIRKDGSIDQDYLQLRMHHLTNFWRRTALGVYDDSYARYVDYVGRSHTSHGADPNIYIHERYVIGQVGFVSHAIREAIYRELHDIDSQWEERAQAAWTKLMMVILEMLARAYGTERDDDTYAPRGEVNHDAIRSLAVLTYEAGLGMVLPTEDTEVLVGKVDEIPEGERKIVQVGDISVGVFHHKGNWYALRNSCLHRGGPVCTGPLNDDTLVCPWHGYQYSVISGKLLVDPSSALAKYNVDLRDGDIYIRVPLIEHEKFDFSVRDAEKPEEKPVEKQTLQENEFLLSDVLPGTIHLVVVEDEDVAVCNIGGTYYAFHNACTHAEGPLNEGELNGVRVTCPWHDSVFDVTSGAVLRGPAVDPVRTYTVTIDGGIGRVE
jgi:nitrite reductase/ring-hydroxylating ferredoxin subunit